ncbi:MAG: S24 family peptidase, partial [Pseudomonadota bacterium]
RVSVSNWESGQTKPDATKLPELEKLLNVDLTPHMTPGWAEIARKHGEGPGPINVATIIPRDAKDFDPNLYYAAHTPSARIPLFGQVVGGIDGEFELNGNQLDDVLRPPNITTDDAYAVLVHGESMAPRFEDGEIAYIDPKRRVKKGDYVVAQIRNPDGDAPLAFIKRYLSWNSKELILEQFNPAKELRFPHEEVVSVHFVAMSGPS